MDYSEPIELEKLIEDLRKAQEKGGFDVIIISGLTYLHGNRNDDLFADSCRLLGEFADQFESEVLIIP